MKVDLKLLSMRFSQMKDELPVSIEGVNKYLLEKILRPCLNGGAVFLRDIDYEAFDVDDIDQLENYYYNLTKASGKLRQFTEVIGNLPAEAQKARTFC